MEAVKRIFDAAFGLLLIVVTAAVFFGVLRDEWRNRK